MKVAIGVDLGGTNMRGSLVAADGRILESLRDVTPSTEGAEAVTARMAKLVNDLKAKLPADHVLIGVGLGVPGPLHRKDRLIVDMVNVPGFKNYPIGAEIEKRTGLKAYLDNDAKSAAYGEAQFGAAKGLTDFIYLTFGTGVGGGIVAGGQMLYGKGDNAGELGHLCLYLDGEPCNCGSRGCLERYVSAIAVERRAQAVFGRPVDGRALFELFAQGDPRAEKFVGQIAIEIATAVGSFLNIFDPQAIVLGGGLFSEGGGPLIPLIRRELNGRCYPSSLAGFELKASTLHGQAGVLGAASLVFRV